MTHIGLSEGPPGAVASSLTPRKPSPFVNIFSRGWDHIYSDKALSVFLELDSI